MKPWPSQTIVDFVCRQSSLEYVTFVAPFSITNEDSTEFLVNLLDKCPKLRHLEVRIDEMNISNELFNKLAKSGLRTLKMECTSIQINTAFNVKEPNRKLQNLYLYELRRNGEVSCKFIETFRNLRFLYVRYVSDAVLEAIWKYQVGTKKCYYAKIVIYTGRRFCLKINDTPPREGGLAFNFLRIKKCTRDSSLGV